MLGPLHFVWEILPLGWLLCCYSFCFDLYFDPQSFFLSMLMAPLTPSPSTSTPLFLPVLTISERPSAASPTCITDGRLQLKNQLIHGFIISNPCMSITSCCTTKFLSKLLHVQQFAPQTSFQFSSAGFQPNTDATRKSPSLS